MICSFSICWSCEIRDSGWCDAFAMFLRHANHDYREKALLALTLLQEQNICDSPASFPSLSALELSEELVGEYTQLATESDEYFQTLLVLTSKFRDNLQGKRLKHSEL